MQICICDDDKAIHVQIRNYIADYFGNNAVTEICDKYSGEELLEADSSTPPELT